MGTIPPKPGSCPTCLELQTRYADPSLTCRECQDRAHDRNLAADAVIYTLMVCRWLAIQRRKMEA